MDIGTAFETVEIENHKSIAFNEFYYHGLIVKSSSNKVMYISNLIFRY